MPEKKIIERIISPGPQSDSERQRLQDIREKVMQEFPPLDQPKLQPVSEGIGAQIRLARESQGMTWYSLAEKAGISDAGVIRDIECGREVTFSAIEAVAAALGLRIELVEQRVGSA
jgi:ribosome-binding protein aMBF1 (putative translation factor)